MDIQKTNIPIIKSEVDNMIHQLSLLNYTYNPNIDFDNDIFINKLKKKYSNLYNTSQTLFKIIIKDINQTHFSKKDFYDKLNYILKMIETIQKKGITQNDASEKVGYMLANEFIPQVRKSS